jgi:hypothetical protein
MKNTTYIRDFYGRILGSIEEDTINHNKTARDFYGRILGTYDNKLKITRDFYGKFISQGDILASLVYNADNK